MMQLSGITASLVNNGFSREQEREADWLGIDYMVKAGYNPEGAIKLQEYFYSELEGGKNPIVITSYSIHYTKLYEAIALYGAGSGAALATVVGVLVEVPVMLSVCSFCNRTRHWFPEQAPV